MAGENALFTASGYGTANYTILDISYGISLVSQQGESRNQRTVYFRNVHTDNFIVTVAFDSWGAYNAAATWFQGYMTQAADPNNPINPMSVLCPVRNFTGSGIPQTGISFGEQVGEIVRTLGITFVGASSSIIPTDDQVNPSGDTSTTAQYYFYPTSSQESSAFNPADTNLFDTPPPTSSPTKPTPPTSTKPSPILPAPGLPSPFPPLLP